MKSNSLKIKRHGTDLNRVVFGNGKTIVLYKFILFQVLVSIKEVVTNLTPSKLS